MDNLPFKINKKEPEIIYVDSEAIVPKIVKEDRLGTNALTYHGKIYAFHKKLPKDVIDHEKAHCEAESSSEISPKGIKAWLEDEVRADLLTYKETGRPERIYDRLHSRASDARLYHMDSDVKSWYNYYDQTKHALEHIEIVYRKYWDYLPAQWKKDYGKFMEQSGRKLERLRKEGKNWNPSKDYTVRRSRIGDYDVSKKRTVYRRDRNTGFVVRGVK